VNPRNGKTATRQVVRTDDVFPGERRDYLPDIAVSWDIDAKVLSELQSGRCGTVKGKGASYQIDPFYTGNHRPAAFVLARGPNIAHGNVLAGGHIVDIAPTIMALLGVDPPRHVDGRVLTESLGAPSRYVRTGDR